MSHSPLLDITEQRPELEADVRAALDQARAFVHDFAPDVVVLFAPDHYNGFFYRLMPPFCLGIAARTVGDYDSLAGELNVPGDLAVACAEAVLADGIDIAVSHQMDLDHATAQPLNILFGQLDATPVIPVFVNAAAPPLAPVSRARKLGESIGKFFGASASKVLFVGSGGLSHDPPVPSLGTASPAVAERLISGSALTVSQWSDRREGAIAEAQRLAAGTSTRRELTPDWDGAFLDILASGQLDRVDGWSNAGISEHGCGAHEIRTWVAAYGALSGTGSYDVSYRYYRPIPEYIAGFAVTNAQPAAADAGVRHADKTDEQPRPGGRGCVVMTASEQVRGHDC
jgi:2,3-dihydroxyphenylpropionate 1,2-dioxygenase